MTGLDNIRMYIDDAFGLDDCPINHVATLATFFARLRRHELKPLLDQSRIVISHVGFLGHLITEDGVRPNDDRVAAFPRLLMPSDIKQLRSLLGGLSYYPMFCLAWLAVYARSRPPSKKALRSNSPQPLRTPSAPFSRNLIHRRS